MKQIIISISVVICKIPFVIAEHHYINALTFRTRTLKAAGLLNMKTRVGDNHF